MRSPPPIENPAAFQSTRWSLVLSTRRAGGEGFREALAELAKDYRPLLVQSVRALLRCDPEEAEDVTQAFFLQWTERGIGEADPELGQFRAYLKQAVRNFARNWRRNHRAVKRGGLAERVSPDVMHGVDAGGVSPEEAFDSAWRRELLTRALQLVALDFEAAGRSHCMKAFRAYYVDPGSGAEPPTYASLASDLGVPVTDVTNWLARGRTLLRQHVTRLVRDSVRDEGAFRREMDVLFGPSSG